jgi:cation diffusion facilitator family transporter
MVAKPVHEARPSAASHPHVHAIADPELLSTAHGLRALKWSFIVLAVGAALQLAVAMLSGSVALLADTIHNAADAATAIPLGIAFFLMRRRPTPRFTYGYGRLEDLAGVAIVLVILFSAIGAAYESARRLIEPRSVSALGAVAAAAVVGFAANEIAALIRTRIGRQINSAALVADGNHARIDGLASLAVAAGAGAAKLGYPMVDPIVGLAIAALILGIVWESAREVFTRMIDGVEPGLIEEMRHAAEHVGGVRAVFHARARWIGHRLHAEADIAVDPALSIREATEIADCFRLQAMHHLPQLAALHIGFRASEGGAS